LENINSNNNETAKGNGITWSRLEFCSLGPCFPHGLNSFGLRTCVPWKKALFEACEHQIVEIAGLGMAIPCVPALTLTTTTTIVFFLTAKFRVV